MSKPLQMELRRGIDPIQLSFVAPQEQVASLVPVVAAAGGSARPGEHVHTAASALGGHRVVRLNPSGGLDYASSDVAWHAGTVLGVTRGAAASGSLQSVVRDGQIEEPTWNWQVGRPVFLGVDGVLTQDLPPAAVFSLVVGFPIAPTRLLVAIREPLVIS